MFASDGDADAQMSTLTDLEISAIRAAVHSLRESSSGSFLDPTPENIENVSLSVLGDGFHFSDQARTPVHHDWKKVYFVALQEAWLAWDEALIQQAKAGCVKMASQTRRSRRRSTTTSHISVSGSHVLCFLHRSITSASVLFLSTSVTRLIQSWTSRCSAGTPGSVQMEYYARFSSKDLQPTRLDSRFPASSSTERVSLSSAHMGSHYLIVAVASNAFKSRSSLCLLYGTQESRCRIG